MKNGQRRNINYTMESQQQGNAASCRDTARTAGFFAINQTLPRRSSGSFDKCCSQWNVHLGKSQRYLSLGNEFFAYEQFDESTYSVARAVENFPEVQFPSGSSIVHRLCLLLFGQIDFECASNHRYQVYKIEFSRNGESRRIDHHVQQMEYSAYRWKRLKVLEIALKEATNYMNCSSIFRSSFVRIFYEQEERNIIRNVKQKRGKFIRYDPIDRDNKEDLYTKVSHESYSSSYK